MNQGRRSMPVADFGPAGASSSGTRVPLVVSVVVHYTGIEQTRACLRSLLASDYDRHRIVLVDNASPEPEAADLRTAFGDSVDVITSERNGGYGAGANLGIRRAFQLGAAYVWVLNNDTIIPADTVRLLVDVMEANPRFGALVSESGQGFEMIPALQSRSPPPHCLPGRGRPFARVDCAAPARECHRRS